MAGLKQDWTRIAAELDEQGWALLPGLVGAADCDRIAALYDREEGFRSRVVMARHGFGRGEYRYFAYPLPARIESLRTALYPRLAAIANGWQERLGQTAAFPTTMPITSPIATRRARPGRRRCCCAMVPAITTACTRTFMARRSFPCRWRSCCQTRARISPAASSS